jgi:hypothetical protein
MPTGPTGDSCPPSSGVSWRPRKAATWLQQRPALHSTWIRFEREPTNVSRKPSVFKPPVMASLVIALAVAFAPSAVAKTAELESDGL